MDRQEYDLFEKFMLSCVGDSAHDAEHVYRVLYTALDIAETEPNVDKRILACACLLHDVGRAEEVEDPSLNHAIIGANKTREFLKEHGYEEDFINKVVACIQTHRFRIYNQPESIEAKILFDADKLDTTGFMGIARTLLWSGRINRPLYNRKDQCIDLEDKNSFIREYNFKLSKLYDAFFTQRAKELAAERKIIAELCYKALVEEVETAYGGASHLEKLLAE